MERIVLAVEDATELIRSRMAMLWLKCLMVQDEVNRDEILVVLVRRGLVGDMGVIGKGGGGVNCIVRLREKVSWPINYVHATCRPLLPSTVCA
jgi:hypothetical protein